MNRSAVFGLLATSVLWPCIAVASPHTDAERQLRDAYSSYRMALFQSNAANAQATDEAMQSLTEKWSKLVADWQAQTPPQYADDTALASTLSDVTAIIAQARNEAAQGELATAHVTLEGVRAELAELHQRNGILSFSDRMNAYHAEMEKVIELGGEGRLDEVAAATAVLDYLARQIDEHPAPEAADAAYRPLVDGMLQSVETLRNAVASADMAKVTQAIAGLKAPYAKLFAKFG